MDKQESKLNYLWEICGPYVRTT